jgi:hypothetical protein
LAVYVHVNGIWGNNYGKRIAATNRGQRERDGEFYRGSMCNECGVKWDDYRLVGDVLCNGRDAKRKCDGNREFYISFDVRDVLSTLRWMSEWGFRIVGGE